MSEKGREISKKMNDEAKKNDARMDSLKETARTSSLEMGWIGYEMKEKNQFPLLGFNTESEYFKKKKIGRSSWFRYTGLAKSFAKLAKQEFLKLIAENADHLAKLDVKLRYRKDLIKAAQTLAEEEFEKLLVKHRSKDEGVEEDDVIVTLKMRLTEGQRKVILETFNWFADQHDIPKDNEAKILELLCVELRHRQPIVTAIMRSVPALRDVSHLLNGGAGDQSLEEVATKAKDGIDAHIRALCTAAGVKSAEELLGQKGAAGSIH